MPDIVSRGREIRLSGLVPFSSVDFPGSLAAVLFLQGCPWACRYCHNPHLQPFQQLMPSQWSWQQARGFLQKRIGFLDGVVFSGGEPTAQTGLTEAIAEARLLGYRIGLHTAGAYPERLEKILPLLDWVGLDIKAPLDERYDRITGAPGSDRRVRASLGLILGAGIAYQLRTTVHPQLLFPLDLQDLHSQLAALGTHATVIQQFRPQGCADTELIASAA